MTTTAPRTYEAAEERTGIVRIIFSRSFQDKFVRATSFGEAAQYVSCPSGGIARFEWVTEMPRA